MFKPTMTEFQHKHYQRLRKNYGHDKAMAIIEQAWGKKYRLPKQPKVKQYVEVEPQTNYTYRRAQSGELPPHVAYFIVVCVKCLIIGLFF